ncbi:hypothetical protein [Rhodococcoides fascians]|uniref:hypothetical protein n=1 Tax=Rhodococcoides fascians TaxID=1828 RepID=UPI000ABDEF71|nr:hypothetical protein [Rhodococcus fascians]
MTTDDEAGIFDAWPTTFEPPTRRIVDPPKSVHVNIALAIGRSGGGRFRDTTALKVRAEGLAMDTIVEGTLFAWAWPGPVWAIGLRKRRFRYPRATKRADSTSIGSGFPPTR